MPKLLRVFLVQPYILYLVLFSSLTNIPAVGQAANEAGVKPFSSFHGGSFEKVNLPGNKLELRLPLVSYPQRGELGLSFIVRWHNAVWNESHSCPQGGHCFYNWQWDNPPAVKVVAEQSPPTVNQYLLANGNTNDPIYGYSIIMPDESQHTLGQISANLFETLDATAIAWTGFKSTNVLTFADGVTYVPQSDGVTTLMQDNNGNQVTFGSSTVTDSLGRTIPLPPVASGQQLSGGVPTSDLSHCTGQLAIAAAALWQVPGPNGGTSTYKFCYANVQIFTNHTFTVNCTSGVNYCSQPNGTYLMLQSIVLPDGQSAWTFDYSQPDANGVNWGDLVKITLPFGGSISYTWATSSNCTVPLGPVGSTYRAVSQRALNANDGNGLQIWKYSGSTVSDPLGNDVVHTFTDLNTSCSLYETQTQYFSGSQNTGTLLQTAATQYSYTVDPAPYPSPYAHHPAINVVPISVTTTLPNGLVKQKLYTYDTGFTYAGTNNGIYGKVVTETDSDWGQGSPGAVLCETDTAYQFQGNSSFQSANIISAVSSVIVKDGAGNQAAKTTFGYDETYNGITVQPSNIGTQLVSPPHGIRANRTSVSKWLLSSNTAVMARAIPFDTGQTYQAVDPLGNATTYSFDSAYAGGYQTKTCLPTVNNVTQCVSGTYDFNTGLLASFTDANGSYQASGTTPGDPNHTRNYSYDNLLRLTSELFPSDATGLRPETDFSYSSLTAMHRSRRQNSTSWLDDYTYFDGLARTVQNTLAHNGIGEYVDTTYDVLGRVSTVSNPHFSTTSPTDGITTTQYDALSRVIRTAKPDGSASSVQYDQASGTVNCNMATDEAGKQRKACSDGLGRVTRIWEDPAGVNYETDYQYDALGNLLRVDQKGSAPGQSSQWRTRLFTYDSLSRLLSASNPESGTISYAYDANGNVLTRTAPAPNQPQSSTATVTTTYTYDALNRLTKKTYSDGKTPIYGYAYDLSSPWGWQLSNYIGRLVLDTSYDPQTGTALNASLYNYDSMGRVMQNEQGCTAGNCSTPSSAVVYTFDLAGELTAQNESQSGVFNVTYSYIYDTAGRPTGLNSSFVDPQHPATLASNITYNPAGEMVQMSYGNGLLQTNAFNKRLQPCRGNLNSSGTVLQQCTDALPSGNVQDFSYGFNLGSGDNGNVVSMIATGNQAFSRTYSYDSLNRLASMSAPGDLCSAMTWTYDAWGNRTAQTGTGGTKCNSGTGSVLSNNQLIGYGYDAAGNMTSDGLNTYIYDAENRIISVSSTANGTTTYGYDAQGRRVTKTTSDGVWRNYVYDTAGQAVAETTASGWQVGYVYFAGQLLIQYRDSTTYFFQQDHLGSTRLVTMLNQQVYDSMDYLPYGEQIAGSTGSTHKFTGKERDSESGLDYFGARYDSSSLGRFLTPDWLDIPDSVPWADFDNPQSLNLYNFVRNNPISYADPDGHDCVVQTRTSDKTETVSVSSGNCDNVKVGDGQRKDYVPGTVTGIQAGQDGKSITIGYTPYDGGGYGVQSVGSAPVPDHPGIAYGYNAAGYNLLGTAGATMNDARTYAGWFGASAAAGAALVGSGVIGGSGLTTLAGEDGLGMVGRGALNRMIGDSQRALLREFFKNGKLPEGLSQRSLQLAKKLAERAIQEGRDGLGEQARRLDMINKVLR